jgi:hypothetical protein
MRLEGLSQFEKSNDLIENRTRHLPACSIVPQPITIPVAPNESLGNINKCSVTHLVLFKISRNVTSEPKNSLEFDISRGAMGLPPCPDLDGCVPPSLAAEVYWRYSLGWRTESLWNWPLKTKLNSVAVVRKRTIPTERPPLVGKVSANLCG